MRKLLLIAISVAMVTVGCTVPAKKVTKLKLGMSPDEVRDTMGEPYTIRAAKIYENGEWTQIWEYQPAVFELNPKQFWLYFENGKLVQWGQPGDFAGKSGITVPVSEYSEQKVLK